MTAPPSPNPADRPPIFEDRSRWLIPSLVGIVALVLIGMVAARPVHRRINSWRAGSFVTEGNAALATNNLPAVSRSVRAAILLAPGDPDVLHLAARYCTRMRLVDGIHYWQLFLDSGRATPEDRREFARLCQSLNRLDLSGQLIQELVSADARDRTNQLLVLDQLALLGDWKRVVTGAEAMVKEFPGDEATQLMLARAYLGTGNPQLGGRAVALLQPLMRDGSTQRQAALRTFATLTGPPPAELLKVADQLEHVPDAPLADRMMAWELRERLKPAESKTIPERALASFPPPTNATDIVTLVEWLRARRRFDLALTLVPLQQARTDSGLLLAYGELLADLHRWKDLETLLREPRLPMNRIASACLHAVLANGTGDKGEATRFLRDAFQAATGSPEMLQQIALFAVQMGQNALAIDIWTAMLQNPATVVPASAILLRYARSQDDFELERMIYRSLIVPLRDQPEVRFQHAYLNVLFNEGLVQAETTLTDLVAHDLGSARFRAALALAKLRLEKPAEALAICESANIDWRAQPARWRVIYAASLQANQQRAAARTFAATIPASELKIPERALLQSVLNR